MNDRQLEEARRRRQAFWPIFGLLMAVALGVIAWLLAPVVLQLIQQQDNRFVFGDLTFDQVRLITAGILFLLFGALTTLIMALFAPKPKATVKDKTLKDDKKKMQEEERKRRVRQMAVDAEMRKQNRERNQK